MTLRDDAEILQKFKARIRDDVRQRNTQYKMNGMGRRGGAKDENTVGWLLLGPHQVRYFERRLRIRSRHSSAPRQRLCHDLLHEEIIAEEVSKDAASCITTPEDEPDYLVDAAG